MAKMFEIKGKTATQNAFFAFAAYNRAITLADEHKVKIDFFDGKKIKATAKSNKAIVAYVDAFESEYEKAHKAYTKAKGKSETESYDSARDYEDLMDGYDRAKATPRKARKAKGNGIDFGKIKGETNKDKNKALHAMLVSKGITNSKSEEYMSVWNARPWAK